MLALWGRRKIGSFNDACIRALMAKRIGTRGRSSRCWFLNQFEFISAHSAWKPYREEREAVGECGDLLNYWPEAEDDQEFGPLRFEAIRIRTARRDQ